jgi:hypothetical protein
MAVVRFSQELRESIANSAAAPFIKKYIAERDALPKTYGLRMYEKGLGVHLKAVQSLPIGFFETMTRVSVGTMVTSDGEKISLPGTPKFEFGSELPVPRMWSGIVPKKLYRTGTYGDFTYYISARDLEDMEFEMLIREWVIKLKAIERSQAEFVCSVNKITNSYTTLAPAIKTWPPLWDLLPAHIQERHKTVVEKRARATAEELDLDLDKMTGVVVTNKLLR